ncbi:MAG: transposase [Anaerolineales bacterium]|nr:transposase [Anaerolineales bacterium]
MQTGINKVGELIITIESTKEGTICRKCGREIHKRHGYDEWAVIRHLPVFGRPSYLRYRPRRYQCLECEDHPTTTQRLDWRESNTDKDQKRQDKGDRPRDPDARWGVKHKRKVKNEEGKEEEQVQYFYGYKAHVSLNATNHLITSLECTSGEVYDGHHFTPLVDHDLEQQLPVETYTADKAYDDGENHYNLEVRGLHSAIRLKKTRTEKKDDNKQVWLDLHQTPHYQQGLKERYQVERKFGEAKQGHGLGRCRYLGRIGFAVQSFFTAIILNLKRMVRLLAGVGFKTQVMA